MPFERYLRGAAQDGDNPMNSYSGYDDATQRNAGLDSAAFSNSVQFQIPQFMYSGAPTLAPGGGAEVIPAGMFGNGSVASSWFSNNGFTPRLSDESFFQSNSNSKGYSAWQNEVPDHQQQQQLPRQSSAPFDYDLLAQPNPLSVPPHSFSIPHSNPPLPLSPQALLALSASAGFTAPSPLGLPVYSASGFDLLSILARVATRPHPKVVLGPVDMTCSFVVVDIRRYDHPIVYCSPTFCRLTGYDEAEVLGRNCRFLQAPDGVVAKGEPRRFTAPEAVAHLRKSLAADKECQTSIINYRKDGSAFINLVTVIPIAGGVSGAPHEENDIVYHVGFQVDLTEQPSAILQKLRDGSYIVNYSANNGLPLHSTHTTRDRKANVIPPGVISKDLKAMLADPAFMHSLPISTSTTVPAPAASAIATEKPDAQESNQTLNLLLLENSPDFIHVVSLKGSFLYVAPSVRRVLGYEPDELVGKSITDFCHPADVVPLTRELKESSAMPPGHADSPHAHYQTPPKTVDLLFRAKAKTGMYVWVECRGRLHVEPGKGRKAIVLSGRAREMPAFPWAGVARAGGLNHAVRSARAVGAVEGNMEVEVVEVEREFWGMVGVNGTFLSVGAGVTDVLGWGVVELIGRRLGSVVSGDEHALMALEEELRRAHGQKGKPGEDPRGVLCRMRRKDGGHANVQVVLYCPQDPVSPPSHPTTTKPRISPSAVIFQIKLIDTPSGTASGHLVHPPGGNVFEELETSRGTSWQYELQQLKFANQKLVDEIGLLEAQKFVGSSGLGNSWQSQPGVTHDHRRHVNTPPSRAQGMPRQRVRPEQQQDWATGLSTYSPYYQSQGTSLKRSWDAVDSGTA